MWIIPTPVNCIPEPVKYGVTTEGSLSANLSFEPLLAQLGEQNWHTGRQVLRNPLHTHTNTTKIQGRGLYPHYGSFVSRTGRIPNLIRNYYQVSTSLYPKTNGTLLMLLLPATTLAGRTLAGRCLGGQWVEGPSVGETFAMRHALQYPPRAGLTMKDSTDSNYLFRAPPVLHLS